MNGQGQLKELEQKLQYTYRDINLLERALTHSSYANERQVSYGSNERLEFLGDSVLGFITADYFYRHFSHLPEGKLTKLRAATVCEKSLHGFAGEIDLGYVLTGESGPPHDKSFTVEVHLNSNVIGRGTGRSKKLAEQAAAREALALMGL